MSTANLYESFLEACQQDGCPFCRAVHAADLRYLDRFFYEQVNDYDLRVKLRASLGFCAEHARMAVDEMQGKALGVAILYEDMLRIAQEELARRGTVSLPRGKCPACENQAEVSKWLLMDLSKHLLEPDSQAALRASQGLCLPHLRQTLEHVRSSEKRRSLLEVQGRRMEALRGELLEFIRKNDYRFSGQGFEDEKDSWRRAAKMTAGE